MGRRGLGGLRVFLGFYERPCRAACIASMEDGRGRGGRQQACRSFPSPSKSKGLHGLHRTDLDGVAKGSAGAVAFANLDLRGLLGSFWMGLPVLRNPIKTFFMTQL